MSVRTFAANGYGVTDVVPALADATALAFAVRVKGSSIRQWAGSTQRGTVLRIGTHNGPEKLYLVIQSMSATTVRFQFVSNNGTNLHSTSAFDVGLLSDSGYYTIYAHRDASPPVGVSSDVEIALYGDSTDAPILAFAQASISALETTNGGAVHLSRTDNYNGGKLAVDGLAVWTRAVPLADRPTTTAPPADQANLALLWQFDDADGVTAAVDAVAGVPMALIQSTVSRGGSWPPMADRLALDDYTPSASYTVGTFLAVPVKAVVGAGGATDTAYVGTAALLWSDDNTVLDTAPFTDGTALLVYALRGEDIGTGRRVRVVDAANVLQPSDLSDPFDVVVAGTQIELTSVPTAVVVDVPFSVEGEIVDAAGNVDEDATADVALTTNLGTLGGTTTVAAVAGRFTFSGLTLDTVGPATLLASAPDLLGALADVRVRPVPTTSFHLVAVARDAASNVLARAKSWTSSDPAVATVAPNGLVESAGIGTCVVTARAGAATATCDVTVEEG